MANAMGVDMFPMKPSLLSPTEVLDEVIDMAQPPTLVTSQPVIFLDAIGIKVLRWGPGDEQISPHLATSVDMDGDINTSLVIWIAKEEGASFPSQCVRSPSKPRGSKMSSSSAAMGSKTCQKQ